MIVTKIITSREIEMYDTQGSGATSGAVWRRLLFSIKTGREVPRVLCNAE